MSLDKRVWKANKSEFSTTACFVRVGGDIDYAFFAIGELYRRKSEGVLAKATRDELCGGGMEVFKKLHPATFNLYMNWLVKDCIPTTGHPDEDRDLVKLYVLGELLEDTKVQRAIVSSLMAKSNADVTFVPSADIIVPAFSQTPSKSALRRLLVDMLAKKGSEQGIETLLDKAPVEFTKALAKELLKKKATDKTGQYTTEDLAGLQDGLCMEERSSKRRKII